MSALFAWLEQPLARALGLTLLHFLWQGLILAVVAAALLWLMRGAAPKVRYAVACVCLLLMAITPPLTFQVLRERPVAQRASSPPLASAFEVVSAEGAGRVQPLGRRDMGRSLPFVLLAWLLGVTALSSRLAGGWVWLQWLRRGATAAGDEQQLLLLRLCQRMGVASNIRLMRCDRVEGPTVLGWLKPVVLVPGAVLAGLTPDQLERILAHELAHILRYDYTVNLIQSAVEVLLFFHPAVWWISRQIRQERELCCDDVAVRQTGDALDYARALTRLESLRLDGPTPMLAMGATGGSFMHRIQRLISPTTPTLLAPRSGLLTLLLVAVATALGARAQGPERPAAEASKPGFLLTFSPDGKTAQMITTGDFDRDQIAKGLGAVLCRYNQDSADGKIKAGMVSLEGRAKPADVLGLLERLAGEPRVGPVTRSPIIYTNPDEDFKVSLYGFNLPPQAPENLRAILQSMPAQKSLSQDEQSGRLVLRRWNTPTPDMQVAPAGLLVDVVGNDVEVDTVLAALLELEAATPTPGVVQEVRKVAGQGKAPKMSLDLKAVEPSTLRAMLKQRLGQ